MEEAAGARPPANRMIIAVLALIGILVAAYMTLYKFGVIGSLACGLGACETVQTSKWATFLGMPVPVLGVVGYAALLGVALVGLQPRGFGSRGIAIALLALATGAFLFSVYLSVLEQFVIRAWCRYCIASAVIATLIWISSLAELPRLRRAT